MRQKQDLFGKLFGIKGKMCIAYLLVHSKQDVYI